MSVRRILVTSALPYANGHIHIGHLVEYIQTDIWVRFQKLRGHNCRFFCADDTHGTAISIRARQERRSEEEVIADMREAHIQDFAGFQIQFDHYGSTNSEENRVRCHEVWKALRAKGFVVEREVTQLFDPVANQFLADRFVKGTCPNCKSPNQYGDSCDKCSATYGATDLIDPVSTLSGARPEVRSKSHLFVEIEKLHGFLSEWTQSGDHLQTEVANYLKGHFLGEPLRDWDISRPKPYFGFEIPDSPENCWYVWFDAPIGYIGSTTQWCDQNGEVWTDWWRNPATEIHHFIGKDITYFHTLFWPAMLKIAELNLPTKVHIHGFLNVGGEKMSKSKGTFIRASEYLKFLDPAALRYYFASKQGPRLDDLDLNFDEFVAKVNSDLVGKFVNLPSRTARFIEQVGLSASYPDDGGLFAQTAKDGTTIAEFYENCDYSNAMRLIMENADRANKFVEDHAPWSLKKDPSKAAELQDVCTIALNLFRQLAIYLAPVLPELAKQAEKLLNQPIRSWDDAQTPLVGTQVSKFEHLMQRVDPKQVAALVEASKEDLAPSTNESTPVAEEKVERPEALEAEPLAPECTIDDFAKVDLRVARVLTAEAVAKSDKLVKLTVTLGGDSQRTIFAGIKTAYDPATLPGRLIVVVANLAPRKMKVGTSEGMVVAAGPGGTDIFILAPDSGAVPGQRVH
jgi:methionyl-tRNA synthetase